MFYTLTTNPAVDLTTRSNGLVKKEVNRTFDASYTANGKGINVSSVLNHFGIKSTVLGFFGGFSGEYILSECQKHGIETSPITIDDVTRINIFLNDGTDEYTLVNQGPVVSKEKQKEFLNLLKGLDSPEYLCISGSLPRGISPDYYEEIMQICNHMGTKVILDISNPKLKELLSYRPFLIKPNDEELYDIFGMATDSKQDIKSALVKLNQLGAQNILLTLGERGSYFYNGTDLYQCGTYKVETLSTACAGDSFLAAFLSIWTREPNNIECALKLGAAAGANAAESAGIGDMKNAPEYAKHIQVEKI